MGIFDKLLRAIGFEDENQEKQKSEEKIIEKKKERNANLNSKFDLKNLEVEESSELEEKEILTLNPKTQVDVEEIASKIREGNNLMVDFADFSENDRIRALDFLSGVSFILKSKIEKLNKTIYLIKNKEN